MRSSSQDYFVSDEADDLEEAIRITLRKYAHSRTRSFRWVVFAPEGWFEAVAAAPPALVTKVQADLRAIDEMRREDDERCGLFVAQLLNLMHSNEHRGAVLAYLIELLFAEHSIPARALWLYRLERSA